MLYRILIAIICLSLAKGVIFEPSEQERSSYGVGFESDFRSGLGHCLRGPDSIIPCLTSGAVQALDGASSSPDWTLSEGLVLVQDNSLPHSDMPRGDPREARTLFEGLGFYMENRALHWDLSNFFPGLKMIVGPHQNGQLEFEMDPRKSVDERTLSTGGLLIKRTLVPVLLGMKLNIASLFPLLFAALIIITKKALLLSKLSFLFSGLSLFQSHALHKPPLGHFPGAPLGAYGDFYKGDYLYDRGLSTSRFDHLL